MNIEKIKLFKERISFSDVYQRIDYIWSRANFASDPM